MISIAVVDSSAESRNSIIEELNACFYADSFQLNFLPRIHLTPLPPEEVKFQKIPDICILGPRMLLQDINELARIRRILPNTALLVRGTGLLESLSMTEHLARLGADDILSDNIAPADLLRKLILHSRGAERLRSGKLLVIDSGKGGLGTTSIAAAVAEYTASEQRKVLLIDLDSETHDLSRFLQVRPCINETLTAILSQQKPILQELVEECVTQVWSDEPNLFIMPPAPISGESSSGSESPIVRGFISVLEVLDSLFDLVVVDMGNAPAQLRRTLWRTSDIVLLVGSNDPAALLASIERATDAYASIAPTASLMMLFNSTRTHGIPASILIAELVRATQLDASHFLDITLPLSKSGGLWPGSGGTLWSHADWRFKRLFKKLMRRLSLFEEAKDPASNESVARTTALRELPQEAAETHKYIDFKPMETAQREAPPFPPTKSVRDLFSPAQIID